MKDIGDQKRIFKSLNAHNWKLTAVSVQILSGLSSWKTRIKILNVKVVKKISLMDFFKTNSWPFKIQNMFSNMERAMHKKKNIFLRKNKNI